MAATPEDKERLRRGSRRNVGVVVVVIVIVLVLVAVAVLAGLFNPTPVQKVTLLGSGATFPYPLITKWSSVYVNDTGGRVQVNYQGIGSGAGIQAITAKTVDFAGSDAPLKPSERAAAPLNPGVALPSSTITVVHRSDSSGTTFVWTSYLHLENPGWNSSLVGKSINWPVGIGASGNAGVAGKILTTPDSIGYVELAYTVQNSMKVGKIRNPAGNFVSPSLASTAAAAASAPTFPSPGGDWNNVTILDAAGANSYPIASFTYLMVYKELNTIGTSMTQAKAQALVDFLWWCVHDPGGQRYASSLVYPPLPQTVVTLDEQAIRSMTFNGQTLHS